MSFSWADDTYDAISRELPDFPNHNFDADLTFEMSEIQIDINVKVECERSLFRCLFYKKYATQHNGREITARTLIRDVDLEEVEERLEEREAKLWPGGGKWRAKKRSH